MGISERKEREKQELKEKIVQAASKLFLEHSFENTSIRMIADEIEYSPATIYLYFKDKNELFFEISQRGFSLFFEYFTQVNHIKDPLERIKELGKVYLKFAIENPVYYDLMFVIRAPMMTHHTEEGWHMGERSHSVLTTAVNECIEQGHFKNHNPEALSLLIWSSVHGLVTLMLRDRLKMMSDNPEEIEKLLFEAVTSFNIILDNA